MLTQAQRESLAAVKTETVQIPEAGEGVTITLRRMDAARDVALWPLNHRVVKKPNEAGVMVEVVESIEPGYLIRRVLACECDLLGVYTYQISATDHAEFDEAVELVGRWPVRVFNRLLSAWARLNPTEQSVEAHAKN